MGVMPGNVSKGPELRRFEKLINSDKDNLDGALEWYEKNGEIEDVIELKLKDPDAGDKLTKVLNKDQRDHLEKHWFSKAGAESEDLYWQDPQPMGKVIRKGLIRALRSCRKKINEDGSFGGPQVPYLPLDAHWVCAGNSFEVVVTIINKKLTM